MNKTLSNFIFTLIIGFFFINCANRGTPDGGPKDETPPSIIKSEPENYSTNFNDSELIQNRTPDGSGPSGKACPRWASHTLHSTSILRP